MSKWIKTQLALFPWDSSEDKNSFKRLMIQAEIHSNIKNKKSVIPISKNPDTEYPMIKKEIAEQGD